ncbi:MAG: Stp1/IreP family PP2C-type Ser/Thr phosphatase [Myxococcales bacterium]|jgi:protein phosphatase
MSDVSQDGHATDVAGGEESNEQTSSPSSYGVTMRTAGSTAVGQVREHNEDNFVVADLTGDAVLPRDEVTEGPVGECGVMFAVCDGMGGAAAGEVASQMAVDILVEVMRRGGAPANRDALARRLVGAVEEAGRRIYESAQRERSRRGMGTTATVAVLIDKVMFLAEVGDSRAYLLRRGELKQLTKDQSLVNQLIEAGHLTEDEAEAFEHSNIILQALGTSESVQVDLTFVELRKGDRLMMCSDGLSGLVHADTLRSTLQNVEDPAECCERLIEYAEGGGGHDNITVIVTDFDGESLAEPTDRDTFGYVQYPLPLEDEDSSAFVDEETAAGGGARKEDEEEEDPETVAPPSRVVASAESEPEQESRENAYWISAGIVAMALAAAVWISLEPQSGSSAGDDGSETHAVPPGAPVPGQQAPSAGGDDPAAEPEVEVNIHTDVEAATLLVNGEARGDVSADASRTLRLRPGAYRFEAQSDGNPVAVTVVTVRGETPMDVFLKLPAGGAEPGSGGGQGEASGDGEQTAGAPAGEVEAPAVARDDDGREPPPRELVPNQDDADQVAPGAAATPREPVAQLSAEEEAERERRRELRRQRRLQREAAQAQAPQPPQAPKKPPATAAPDEPAEAPSAGVEVQPDAPSEPPEVAEPSSPPAPTKEIPDNPF